MKNKRVLALLTAGQLAFTSFSFPAQSQPALSAAACFIPGVGWVSCTVLSVVGAGVAAYYVVRVVGHGKLRLPSNQVDLSKRYPTPQAGPRPAQPREMRAEMRFIEKGVATREACRKMAARMKSEGYRVGRVGTRKNNIGSGGVLDYICQIETDAPEDFYSRYNYYDAEHR